MCFLFVFDFEPRHEKTCFTICEQQRRRSAFAGRLCDKYQNLMSRLIYTWCRICNFVCVFHPRSVSWAGCGLWLYRFSGSLPFHVLLNFMYIFKTRNVYQPTTNVAVHFYYDETTTSDFICCWKTQHDCFVRHDGCSELKYWTFTFLHSHYTIIFKKQMSMSILIGLLSKQKQALVNFT